MKKVEPKTAEQINREQGIMESFNIVPVNPKDLIPELTKRIAQEIKEELERRLILHLGYIPYWWQELKEELENEISKL